MFTGIIEGMGEVRSASKSPGGMRIAIAAPALGLTMGDSIAVNGVCLTAVEADGSGFEADVILETLAKTNLGRLRPGSTVNLERPMPADGRFSTRCSLIWVKM